MRSAGGTHRGGPRLLGPGVVAMTAALLMTALARDAFAFCRSTTCRGDCPTDDDGCPTSGKPLYWAGNCVGYSLNKDGTQNLPMDEVRVAIQKSFFEWTERDCGTGKRSSLAFSAGPDVVCKRSEYKSEGPNVNVILFRDDDWTYKGIDGTLAKTTVTFDANTGEILDADIEVNAAFNSLTVRDTKVSYDLQSIMTHEVGHMIGFAHSPQPQATMFASYDPGTTDLRSLSPDDIAALCEVYPPGRAAKCDPTPRGGFSDACPAPDSPGAKKGCAMGHGEAGASSGYAVAIGALLAVIARRAFATTVKRRK